MNEQIVVIGGGPAGILAANRLQAGLDDAGHPVLVIDRTDPRDQELDLLVALGIHGPGTLQPPEHLRLREKIGFRLADAATIDPDRKEVCLTDGTTVPYQVLVLATGRHPIPPTAGDQPLAVAAGSPPSTSRPDVFAVAPAAAGPWPAAGQPIPLQVEHLVGCVHRYLNRCAPLGNDVANTSTA